MPKTATDYSRTIIYKLCCKNPEITDIYIGHTTDFNNRKSSHKSRCNNPNSKKYNLYVYKFIRDNDGWDNFDMIQIEAYYCNDRREAESRERYWIETLKSSLNKQIPTQTKQEYDKIYYEKNKDERAEYHKNYYEQNKDEICEYNKKYREINKDEITEKNKEKMTCECGSKFRLYSKSNHIKSIKHQDYLLLIEEDEPKKNIK